jgi:hypothetical protein
MTASRDRFSFGVRAIRRDSRVEFHSDAKANYLDANQPDQMRLQR